MKRLSVKQENLVSDMEAAALYYVKYGRPKPITIKQLCERAGHDYQDFLNVITALKNQGKIEGLIRLNNALLSVDLHSRILKEAATGVISDEEETAEETPTVQEQSPEPVRFDAKMPPSNDRKVLMGVLEILESVDKRQRERIMASAQLFYGIGGCNG